MDSKLTRRTILQLAGIGGIVVVGGTRLARAAALPDISRRFGPQGAESAPSGEFYFVQVSDIHLGFEGAKVNPDAAGTLAKVVASVNALDERPDFIVFTGDLTHTTEDAKIRRARMELFKKTVADLKVKNLYYIPGEHDAAPDEGKVYREIFGKPTYSFDHKGVHFIALDNVSDPGAILGDAQIEWLKDDLAKQKRDARIVLLAHRPLFDLYAQWDWSTRDAQKAIDLLMPFQNVTVFYGHIHQEHHHKTGHIEHHAAMSTMFALPAPGSVPKKAPIPWDAAAPYKGLGFREVEAEVAKAEYQRTERPVVKA
jgi:predicted phosphodiesterase